MSKQNWIRSAYVTIGNPSFPLWSGGYPLRKWEGRPPFMCTLTSRAASIAHSFRLLNHIILFSLPILENAVFIPPSVLQDRWQIHFAICPSDLFTASCTVLIGLYGEINICTLKIPFLGHQRLYTAALKQGSLWSSHAESITFIPSFLYTLFGNLSLVRLCFEATTSIIQPTHDEIFFSVKLA